MGFTNQQGIHQLDFCKAIFCSALLHTCAEPSRDIMARRQGIC